MFLVISRVILPHLEVPSCRLANYESQLGVVQSFVSEFMSHIAVVSLEAVDYQFREEEAVLES